jgi:hypothetical protein
MTQYIHFSNGKSHLTLDYERYSCPAAPIRSGGRYIKRFCAEIDILIHDFNSE